MSGEATLQMQVLQALAPGACLTTEELSEMIGANRHNVSLGACGLIRRGYLERREVGCYQLTTEGIAARERRERLTSGPNKAQTGIQRPRQRSVRDRIWSALIMRERATIGDLLELAGVDPDKSYANARRYLRSLADVGVVVALKRREAGDAVTSNGYIRYQLIRNLGPIAPRVRKNGVLDLNSNTYLEAPS